MYYLEEGKKVEEAFAKEYLTNITWATKEQDMIEHWDMQGILDWIGEEVLKFDVKGYKKLNRNDSNFQDDITWVEGKNVHGKDGWIKGKADYIVFERQRTWICANRIELYDLVSKKLYENKYRKGKDVYCIYQRENRLDAITLVPFKDIIDLESTWNLPK